MYKLKKFSCFVIIIIMSIELTACVEEKSSVDTMSKENKQLVYDIEKLPNDLEKLDEYNSRAKEFSEALFEGLVYEKQDNIGNSNIEYGLAKSCDISKDGLVYTFTLRDNIKWSDGKSITASDFCDFFRDILKLDYNSIYRNELKIVFGVEDYISKKTDFSSVAITSLGENILQIRLNSPEPYLLDLLSQPMYGLRKINSKLTNWKKNYGEIAYTGPFKIQKITNDNKIYLTKNKNYVFKDSVSSENLVLLQGKNGGEYSLADFETNKNIDIFLNPPSTEVQRLKSKNQEKIYSSFTVESLFFNLNSEASTSDVSFRKAINYALDKNKFKNATTGDFGQVNNSFFPVAMNTELKSITLPSSSSIEALNCLNKSSYNGETIKMVYLDQGDNQKICQQIIKNINDSIPKKKNIEFQLIGYSSKDIDDVIKSNDYDIYFGEYNLNYNDPMAFLEMWQSKYPANIYGYNDDNYNNFIYDSSIAFDINKRNELYSKALKELVSLMPIIPVYTKNIGVCSKVAVKGLEVDKYGNIEIEKLSIR